MSYWTYKGHSISRPWVSFVSILEKKWLRYNENALYSQINNSFWCRIAAHKIFVEWSTEKIPRWSTNTINREVSCYLSNNELPQINISFAVLAKRTEKAFQSFSAHDIVITWERFPHWLFVCEIHRLFVDSTCKGSLGAAMIFRC